MDQLQIIARRNNAPRTREYGSHRVRRRMYEDKDTERMNRRKKSYTQKKNRWSLRGTMDRFRNRRKNRSSSAVSGMRG